MQSPYVVYIGELLYSIVPMYFLYEVYIVVFLLSGVPI